jgi:hypothetical protein
LKKEHSLRIWPFFDYEKDETGHERLSFLYLFPFKEEGFERNLSPLFRIFRWEKDPKKGISANLLWGFYKRMKKEEKGSWEIAHLIGMRREEGWKTLFFLKGLFRYRSDGKSAHLRFLYLPLHLQWSHRHSSHLSSSKRDEKESLPKINVPPTLPSPSRGEGEGGGEKEFMNGQQEDRDIGDRFISSRKDPYQF